MTWHNQHATMPQRTARVQIWQDTVARDLRPFIDVQVGPGKAMAANPGRID
jgi:hypothetical protein